MNGIPSPAGNIAKRYKYTAYEDRSGKFLSFFCSCGCKSVFFYAIISTAKPHSEGYALKHTNKAARIRRKLKQRKTEMGKKEILDGPATPESTRNREFDECICTHRYNLEKPYQKPEYLRLITALFGYDITKGLSASMSDDKIYWTIMERFRDSENDKVVLATIGSVLQICATLATPPRDTNQPAGNLDFEKFCSTVQRLYGCDLRGYNYDEVGDFRYHVMAYLKGRTAKERKEEDSQKNAVKQAEE